MKSGKLRLLRADPVLKLADGHLRLRVLVDRTSMEAFANRGEVDVSAVCFPDFADQTLALTVEGGRAANRSARCALVEVHLATACYRQPLKRAKPRGRRAHSPAVTSACKVPTGSLSRSGLALRRRQRVPPVGEPLEIESCET